MKKSTRRFAAIAVFTSFTFLLISQNIPYRPFPETSGNWIVTVTNWGAPYCPPSGGSLLKYTMNGDTVMGAHSYKKVYVATSSGYPGVPYGKSYFTFAYRNDSLNKKVFICLAGTIKDLLWFDFNLTVGDTLPETYAYTSNGHTNGNKRSIVSSIDNALICGVMCKKFNFDCTGGFETSLIEGQGFEDLFFKTAYSSCPFEPCTTYHTTFAHCDFTGMTEIDPEKLSFSLQPNPVSGLLTINADKILITESIIVDSSGRLVLRNKHETSIDVNTLNPGLYLLKLKTEKGEFSQKFIKE